MTRSTTKPNVDATVVHTLAACDWVEKGLPLCLIGDSGIGESHLLIALGTLAAKLVNELIEAACGGP
ncbi:DNA replication protein DnaC [Kibdelosporangium banguiense]|uniref:DNA replication protein DnaC n=1 Tax=Kibdelosporangium banguiense TaxID=1365924 RepID=A0ABS4TTU5_9PSEU|nr:ATP-binding protein [Kibdelosporangium banguiense]MBP2327826.1 DNA replication protein DnaC [Kibdelosporangium banguiense]